MYFLQNFCTRLSPSWRGSFWIQK